MEKECELAALKKQLEKEGEQKVEELNQRRIKMGHSPRFAKESRRLSYGESGERYELGLDGMRSIPKPKRSDSTRFPQSPINSSGSLTDKQIKWDINVPFEMFNGLKKNNNKEKVTANTFMEIIREGNNIFEEKTGRPMTYSEMYG